MDQLMPLYPETSSSLASFRSRLVLRFWYQLIQAVLENRPLNGCSAGSYLLTSFLGWCGWNQPRRDPSAVASTQPGRQRHRGPTSTSSAARGWIFSQTTNTAVVEVIVGMYVAPGKPSASRRGTGSNTAGELTALPSPVTAVRRFGQKSRGHLETEMLTLVSSLTLNVWSRSWGRKFGLGVDLEATHKPQFRSRSRPHSAKISAIVLIPRVSSRTQQRSTEQTFRSDLEARSPSYKYLTIYHKIILSLSLTQTCDSDTISVRNIVS